MMKLSDQKICMLRLIGRILLSLLFILAGFGKISAFAGTAQWIGSVGLPFPEVITALVILLEVVGGLMLLVGLKTREVALLFAIFSILSAAIFHANFADQIQMTMFLKNLSIAGGMLYVVAFGAGRYSMDAKMEKKETPAM